MVVAHRFVHRRMVILDRQDIVSTTDDDLRGDVFFASHGIHGDDGPCEFELLEQFRNCYGLIGLLVDGLASQDDAVLGAPSGDAMEHAYERLLVMGPP